MGIFFRILLGGLKIIRVITIGLMLYGLFWLQPFQVGESSGPYWLLILYDIAIPLLITSGLAGLVLLFFYGFLVGLLPGQSVPAIVEAMRSVLAWIVGLGLFGGLPSYIADYNYLQMVNFDGGIYHLIERTNETTSNYLVFKCPDPIGLWCERTAGSSDVPAPPPTPTPWPEVTAVVEGEVVTLPTPAIPTVTPPARLITDTLGIELALQVGSVRAVITQSLGITETVPTDTVQP